MEKLALLQMCALCPQLQPTQLLQHTVCDKSKWVSKTEDEEERATQAAHKEFHLVTFQLNPPVSPGQAGASGRATGRPSELNTSDTPTVGQAGCLLCLSRREDCVQITSTPARSADRFICLCFTGKLEPWLVRCGDGDRELVSIRNQ